MKQYSDLKAKYPETILLFRLGDFYETFLKDAEITSKVLGITLTKRNNGLAGETPLAGFPYHALEKYIPKFLQANLRVAICEQLEDPKLAKGIVKRDVVEVFSPGVAFSDGFLNQKKNNFLLSFFGDDIVGVSVIDISTGEFFATEIQKSQLQQFIQKINPSELIVKKEIKNSINELFTTNKIPFISSVDSWVCSINYSTELLTKQFNTPSLKGFGLESHNEATIAAGMLLHYLNENQKSNIPHICSIRWIDQNKTIQLDSSTIKNLEIILNKGETTNTLLSVIDETLTAMGSRLISKLLINPLKDVNEILERLTAVRKLKENKKNLKELISELSKIQDVERLLSKIATQRATPRDVIALKNILKLIPTIKKLISESKNESSLILKFHDSLNPIEHIIEQIELAISDDSSINLGEGNSIKKGYNAELDDLVNIATKGKDWILNLQQTERERTGINSLKIGFNSVYGYYIEITNTHKSKVPVNYIRKQTMTTAERYITPELKEYEEKIFSAEEKILKLETELFTELRTKIGNESIAIQLNGEVIANLDVLLSFAIVAEKNNFCEPIISDSSILKIKNGRHPVIEKLLPYGEEFIPNSIELDTIKNQILVITGPNMSGKSSFIRQTGIIVLLAQVGSFVPADSAEIGIVDNIFTRVGASDNISTGESTFLVEMHEASRIIHQATNKSLILLDELGRGTSTFDGISIAWSLTEYLHNKIGARTLFATHYHELNELAQKFERIKNYKADVKEYDGKIIFTHKILPGFADHSYGIYVAEMAGLPKQITNRAKEILKNLESSDLSIHTHVDELKQLNIFELKEDWLREELKNVDINSLTPVEALNLISKLKLKLFK
ncbi:MAG: DNA mismatch repair protein MutS [Bacteroidetes bacterium]|nr:DNA mismatch repair protein MutS [Bacteroidota bacterium]